MSTTGKKKKTIKKCKHMEAKQHASELPTNHRQNQKINLNMHRNKWKWKHANPKSMEFSKSSAEGKVHSNTSLPQETREKSNI